MCSVSIRQRPSTFQASYSSSLRTSRSRKGSTASAFSSSRSTVVACTAFIVLSFGAAISVSSRGTHSDEEEDTRTRGLSHERRNSTELNPIEELVLVNSHDVHGHGAADHPHAKLARQCHQLLERRNLLLLHHRSEHGGADAEVVHLRDAQGLGRTGRHHREHLLHQVPLRDGCTVLLLEDRQTPKREEESRFQASRGGARGDDESGHGTIKIAAEDDQRRSVLWHLGAQCRNLFANLGQFHGNGSGYRFL